MDDRDPTRIVAQAAAKRLHAILTRVQSGQRSVTGGVKDVSSLFDDLNRASIILAKIDQIWKRGNGR